MYNEWSGKIPAINCRGMKNIIKKNATMEFYNENVKLYLKAETSYSGLGEVFCK